MTATNNNSTPTYSDAQIKDAMVAVCISFVLFGLILGMWFVHIPSVVTRLQIDKVSLGFILLTVPMGGAVAQPISGLIAARFGARPLLFVAYIWAPIAVILPIVAWSEWSLIVGLFILGMSTSTLNIGKAIQGSQVEIARGKATMPMFHGFFSVGILIATILGTGIFAFDLGDGSGVAMVSAIAMVVGLWSHSKLLPNRPAKQAAKSAQKIRFKLPNTAILALVALAFLTNLAEGTANNWSALYLTEIKFASESVASAGLAMFSFAMAIVRFAGGPMVDRVGEKPIVVGGGVLIAIGMGLVVWAPWAILSAVGFAIIGMGAANIIPIAFSAAGRVPDVVHAMAITSIANATMLGVFVGPPLVGLLADWVSLPFAMMVIGGLGLVIALGGSRKKWR